jgi:hypothetical protein
MKTMHQMRLELLEQAKFDGTCPKPVVLPFGILALARNDEEFTKLRRESDTIHLALGVGVIAVALGFCVLLLWELVA